MLRTSSYLLAAVSSFLLPTLATADLIRVSGEIDDVPLNGQGFVNETFSARFSFLVDGSLSGQVEGIPLTSLELSPATLGATTFDETNSQAAVFLQDGGVLVLVIYGTPDGLSITSTNDDFGLAAGLFTASGDVSGNVELVASSSAFPSSNYFIDSTGSGFVTLQSVPEPNALLLVAMGCVGLVRRRT